MVRDKSISIKIDENLIHMKFKFPFDVFKKNQLEHESKF